MWAFTRLWYTMRCLKCGNESKYEFCRKCKEIKHSSSALVSQNKKKLRELLYKNILEPENFNKFILYANNILQNGKIYMEYKEIKEYKTLKIISWATMFASLLIAVWSWISIWIVRM